MITKKEFKHKIKERIKDFFKVSDLPYILRGRITAFEDVLRWLEDLEWTGSELKEYASKFERCKGCDLPTIQGSDDCFKDDCPRHWDIEKIDKIIKGGLNKKIN